MSDYKKEIEDLKEALQALVKLSIERKEAAQKAVDKSAGFEAFAWYVGYAHVANQVISWCDRTVGTIEGHITPTPSSSPGLPRDLDKQWPMASKGRKDN